MILVLSKVAILLLKKGERQGGLKLCLATLYTVAFTCIK